MKIYEIKLADQEVNDDLRISLVENPAVELTLMKFNKEEKGCSELHHFSDHEKKLIFSVAMVPNKLIYRDDVHGEPAEVFYSVETVEKFRDQYFTSKRDSNLYHMDESVGDINVVESWIVEDPETDKSKAMGFSGITKGTWMVGMKINNNEVWQDHIKTGKITGFSIEGHFLHELSDKPKSITNIKMRKEVTKTLFEAIRKVAMESELKEFLDGDVKFYAVDLEVGSIITDADGNPMANSEFKQMVDGNEVIYKTDEIGAIVEGEKEEVKSEEMEEVIIEGTPSVDVAKMQEELDALRSENEDLKAKLAEKEAEVTQAETQLVAMAKQTLARKPIGLTPTKMSMNKSYKDMSVRERFDFERSQK